MFQGPHSFWHQLFQSPHCGMHQLFQGPQPCAEADKDPPALKASERLAKARAAINLLRDILPKWSFPRRAAEFKSLA